MESVNVCISESRTFSDILVSKPGCGLGLPSSLGFSSLCGMLEFRRPPYACVSNANGERCPGSPLAPQSLASAVARGGILRAAPQLRMLCRTRTVFRTAFFLLSAHTDS